VGDGTYKRHRLAEDVNPWLAFAPNGDALKCSQLLEYVFKRLANAYHWRISSSESDYTNLSADARISFEFYKRYGAEHLFWLDKPTFIINWQVVIQPILKEGDVESLNQWGIQKPSGVVRTKEDIKKIYQLIEMAAREFEYGDAIEVTAFPTLEEQYESMKDFLSNLPYFYMGPKERKKEWLARKTEPICMDGRTRMDGAIYVVGPNVGGWLGIGGDIAEFSAYPQVAALVSHIAIRLRNNHSPQMNFCTNLVNPQKILKVAKPHRFYEEVDALSLFDSPLPLALIYESFHFEVGELDYGPPPYIPTRVLDAQDILKVWHLFEIAVRDFIEQREYMEIGSSSRTQKSTRSIFAKSSNQKPEDRKQRSQRTTYMFRPPHDATIALIPAGEFMMGGDDKDRDDERPIHTLYLDAFYMDVYEVTNAQYQEFMKATGHKAPRYWHHPRFNVPSQPVIGVTWYDAVAYCEWIGKRLPTEAEWEKAARGGLVGKQYPWGDTWDPSKVSNNGIATTPVGSFPPNGYGLYDMSGNLWEWCADWYDFGYYAKSPKRNPKGPSSGSSRVVRGGSWLNAMNYLRVAVRGSLIPLEASYNYGFRCADDDNNVAQSHQNVPLNSSHVIF